MKYINKHSRLLIAFPLFVILICLENCSPGFLSEEEMQQIKYRDKKVNSVIYYEKSFNVINDNEMEINTHYLLKAGSNQKALPEYLYVNDGTILKLTKFAVKVIKKDRSTETFGKGDLYIQNLSSSRQISELYIKYLPIDKYISAGDLIEIIYSYKTEFAPLGFDFTLSEIDYFAENISCSVKIPKDRKLLYKVVNDTQIPEIITGDDGSEQYVFKWKEYNKKDDSNNPFEKKNSAPGLFAVSFPSAKSSVNWIDFGNWYLNLIGSKIYTNEILKQKAAEIIKAGTNDKEKLDAILNYVQKNIRYEQVYLPKGEIIPNKPELVLSRGYGDCKDYSILIYSLAKSIGLQPHLVLCYRGRGNEFYEDVPVDQFNHMIVHYSYNGFDYWYDGTNRTGIPGITTNDLINQCALVLEKDSSRIIKIKESQNNLFSIKGKLKADGNDLKGDLTLNFEDQFAIDYTFAAYYLSKQDLEKYLISKVKKSLNESIIISDLKWKSAGNIFTLNLKCDIPNSNLTLNNMVYTSIAKIFPSLLTPDTSKLNLQKVFYFPGYNLIKLDVILENLSDPNSNKNSEFNIKYYNYLPAGPFNEDDKLLFISKYKTILNEFTKTNKLIRNKSL